MSSFVMTAAGGMSISANPDPNGLPGSHVFSGFVNGLFYWGLLASLLAVFAGVIWWQVAGHSQNHHHAGRGKMAVLMGGAGAFICGAGPALVSFFASHGHSIH